MSLCTGRDVFSDEHLAIEGDAAITHVDPLLNPSDADTFVAPGFIDLQVNGFAGADYNNPQTSNEEVATSLVAMFSTGVTRCLPTVITGPEERITGALRNLARARESVQNGSAIEGFHVEGPHISPEDGPRGAHPAAHVRPPDVEEYKRWQDAAGGLIKIITLSPEWPEAPSYIDRITREGVVASIGHTRGSSEQIRAAVAAGATMSTHLGNGANPTLPKTANYIWDQLAEDKLAAGFIVDGHHLPIAFLRVAMRAKGIERSVLVTDAVAPAMSAPGRYELGEVALELLEDGRVVMPGTQRLAGSSLRMDRAISNVMATGVSLRDAITMATINPARVGRIRGRTRGWTPGERNDVVRFRVEAGRVTVVETWLGGRRVYSNASEAAPNKPA
jgi:N-acetylglucosamine-6-phosphate deacetylase